MPPVFDQITRRDALTIGAAGVALSGAPIPSAQAAGEPGQQSGAAPKYLILACDGGGIRGYLTALIVERLNKEVPFIDRVNLFAGTSTGSILAIGLAHGLSPESLVKLYRDEGEKIFDRTRPRPEPSGRIGKFWELVKDHSHFVHEHLGFHFIDLLRTRYPKDGLESALTAVLGDATFRDLKPGKAAIVTTLRLLSDQKSWVPLVLHNLDVAGDYLRRPRLRRPDPGYAAGGRGDVLERGAALFPTAQAPRVRLLCRRRPFRQLPREHRAWHSQTARAATNKSRSGRCRSAQAPSRTVLKSRVCPSRSPRNLAPLPGCRPLPEPET